jgi:hypothetical protein
MASGSSDEIPKNVRRMDSKKMEPVVSVDESSCDISKGEDHDNGRPERSKTYEQSSEYEGPKNNIHQQRPIQQPLKNNGDEGSGVEGSGDEEEEVSNESGEKTSSESVELKGRKRSKRDVEDGGCCIML